MARDIKRAQRSVLFWLPVYREEVEGPLNFLSLSVSISSSALSFLMEILKEALKVGDFSVKIDVFKVVSSVMSKSFSSSLVGEFDDFLTSVESLIRMC